MYYIDIKTRALDIANTYYPNAQCIILTGSQIEPEYLTSQSDIDIIVIDNQFVGMSCECIQKDDYKVDFTRLGYYNLSNLLIDNSYSGNPVIFEMLKNCIILKDITGIAELTIKFCEMLRNNGNNDLHNEARILNSGLIKLRKHIQKKLDKKYNLFLITDFLRFTVSTHLFIINKGWYPYDGFRLVKFTLSEEKNSTFLNNVIKLTEDYINNPSENINVIISYIDKYLFALNNLKMLSSFNKRIIINLNFRGQNHDTFFREICHSILQHSYLSKFFVLSQNHSYKYIFKHTYIIIFNNQIEDYDELLIRRGLEDIFFKQRIRITDFSITNPHYIYAIFCDDAIYDQTEKLLSFINKEIIRMVYSDGLYNEKKIFLLSVIVSFIFIKSIRITPDVIMSLCSYLIQKWTPKDYNHDINYLNLMTILKKREIEFNDAYIGDYLIFNKIITKNFIRYRNIL